MRLRDVANGGGNGGTTAYGTNSGSETPAESEVDDEEGGSKGASVGRASMAVFAGSVATRPTVLLALQYCATTCSKDETPRVAEKYGDPA